MIVERYLPGTETPCPALVPGSLLRVYRWEPFHEDDTGSSNLDIFNRHPDSRNVFDASRWSPTQGSSTAKRLRENTSARFSRAQEAPAQVSDEEDKSPDTSSDGESPPPGVKPRRVYRHERNLLMKAFKREMRLARRVYRQELRVNFDAEVQAGQEGKEEDDFILPSLSVWKKHGRTTNSTG